MNELIKSIRLKAGLSQEQFASALSTTPVSVSRWENDVTIPNRMAQDKIFEFCMLNHIDCFDEIVKSIRVEPQDGKIILYHGSKCGIEGDILPISRTTCDFGRGFYLGTDPIQPLTLISDEDHPVVYAIELDLSDLNIIEFELDRDWALLVSFYREYMDDAEGTKLYEKYSSMLNGYDVAVGYIADDRMYRVMKSFFERNITDVALIKSLSSLDLGMQYVLKTHKACKRAKIIKKKRLSPLELAFLKLRSKERRLKAIDHTEDILSQYRRVGLYYDELLEEEK